MRTSQSQFEVMVDFMEKNGDLNKPADGPHGRLTAVAKWEELTNALNLDTTGTAKPVDKWKKVWSDLKNNTKRKASKIHQASGGTGGGPASKLNLTDLEQRVLGIIGPQAATGLINIEEVGLELVHPPQPSAALVGGLPLERILPESPTPIQQDVQVESIVELWNRPGGSSQSTPFPTRIVDATATTPTAHHAQSPTSRHATRRVIRGRRRRSLSTSTPAPPAALHSHRGSQRHQVDAASQQFLASDEHWRNLATEFVAENVRLRELEHQQQAQWQTLFAKLIDLVQNYINK